MRFSALCLAAAVVLLVAAPWVHMSARWPVYAMGIAALLAAAIFRFSND
jgi:membrane protein YdbS with pleckstrin-like domain